MKDIAPLADRVYACGPRQMLQAVAEWAERQDLEIKLCKINDTCGTPRVNLITVRALQVLFFSQKRRIYYGKQ